MTYYTCFYGLPSMPRSVTGMLLIEKVSKIIEQQTHKDPEAARRLSDHIAGAMEGLNSTLLLRQLFTPRRDKKLTQTLDQLTTAVEKLNALLEDSSFPPQPSKPEEQ